ncbi:MAG: UDP-N-acetylmuramoyl-L-alanyl-D-glutamate--2,6-diaminopimelate ligase [Bacteroidales bacterium]|nr:UDP-N-acetylmuramoyl-L-alanyl-D-glutamate--2,6-diaminopimelate ligase [Bacteroidales bacterium]
MKLSEIIKGIDCQTKQFVDVEISDIAFDSRQVAKGMLFVAQRGTHVDGHQYIDNAVKNGAAAVLCETLPVKQKKGVAYLVTPNSDEALGVAASNFYENPSQRLKLIGITGTNGKTTSVTLLHHLFRLLGVHAGLLSTIVNKVDEDEWEAHHTTPDALELNSLLRKMADAGCKYCFMEVSSHAIAQRRIAGLTFAGGIFSNVTHDHLDYHKTMANYIAAKKKFFDDLPPEAFVLTNLDDKNGMVMVQNTKATVKTYSLLHPADYKARVLEDTFQGMHLEINGKDVWCRLAGRFNAQNLTAIYAVARLCGVEEDEALRTLSQLEPAPGRFQHVRGNEVDAIVDYAHTPDALQNVMDAINEMRQRRQRLIVVVGCGGDRDKAKRPKMAKIAVTGADRVILTSDNPRTENPEAILDDMETGLSNEERVTAIRIADRRSALRAAVMMAKQGDIILVAGKGHENYQEINGVRHHFDDQEELRILFDQHNDH